MNTPILLITFNRPTHTRKVLELKWDKSADSAIRQIREKRYAGVLRDFADEVLLVGINYSKKTKEHECKIEKWSKMAENKQKPPKMAENDSITPQKPPFPLMSYQNVYEQMYANRKLKYSEIEAILHIGESTIRRAVQWMKENGYIDAIHSKIKGEWQLKI